MSSLPVSGSTIFSLPISFIISLVTLVGDAGPDVDDLVVALAVGDEPFLVLIDDALHFGLRLAEQDALRLRDDHVVHADRDAGARRVVEAERAQAVGEEDRRLVAVLAVASVDERRERLLVERLVDEIERQTLGQDLGDEAAADGRVDRILRRRPRTSVARTRMPEWSVTSPWSYAMRTSSTLE